MTKHFKCWSCHLAIALALLLSGCAYLDQIYPPPDVPVCSKPEAAGSVICAVATRINMTPEQIDAAFLDAALVGIGTKIVKADDLRAAVTKARAWVQDRDILTIDGLTKYLVQEAQVDPALALLLSRRLGMINLPDLGIEPVTAYDRDLILSGLQHQLDQLAYF